LVELELGLVLEPELELELELEPPPHSVLSGFEASATLPRSESADSWLAMSCPTF